MEKGNNTVGLLVAAFVCLFIGLSLIGVVATEVNSRTDLTPTTQTVSLVKGNGAATNGNNNTYNYPITEISEDWKQDVSECSAATLGTSTNIVVYNSTGSEMMNNGACTDINNDYYYVNSAKTIRLCNSAVMNTTTTATLRYQACADDYVQGWAGNMLILIPGFFALALLGCSLALFYAVANNTGIVN